MELRHIRYFLAIAEERNFTRAAGRLGIAQPPLSQQIKSLEEEVGTQLFRRLPQGVELTEAGQAFLQIVAGMPGMAEKATLAAQRATRGEVGSLRVGFSDSSAYEQIVSTTIRDYREKYPDVDFGLDEAPTFRLVEALKHGDLDVGFLRSPENVKIEGLHVRTLASEPLLAACPTTAGRASGAKLSLRDLKDEAFILFHPSAGPMNEIVRRACEAAGFQPRLGAMASQAGSVLTYVAAGFGVALVPCTMRHSHLEGVAYHEISNGPTIGLSLAWRRDDHSTTTRNFVTTAGR